MARAFQTPIYPKFAATVDQAGIPNVVPLLSARLIDPGTIAFVKFMAWKTKRNLETNGKAAFACIGPWGWSYLVQGRFQEWVTKGPLLERFESEAIYRYNAYMGANLVGVIKVTAAREFSDPGMVSLLVNSLRRRPATDGMTGPMPVQVVEKWSRRIALKFLGLTDAEGEPLAVPHQGLFALSASELVFSLPRERHHPLASLAPGAPLAAAVFTPEPAAYQVKGQYQPALFPGSPGGRLKVSEVYAASPPLPGKRIFPATDESTLKGEVQR
jgi:hypothetical protein